MIRSDSQAAIEALSSHVTDSKMIWECRNTLNEVGKKNKVFLIWVPSHSGIKGNEEANPLAKEGARMSLIGPEPYCGIGKCEKDFLEKQKAETECGICQGYIIPHKKYLDLSKKQLHLLTGFLAGHCCLSYTDECRFCGEEEETPIHLVTEYFGIASLKRECIGQKTCKSEKLASLKPSHILDFIRSLELECDL